MSDTVRDVCCYVVNNTETEFYLSSDNLLNGEYSQNPQTILKQSATGGGAQQLFYVKHDSGMTTSHTGSTGMVFYNLGNGFILQLSFNNPYNQTVGSPDMGYACFTGYFYAGITTGAGASGISGYQVGCTVTVNGNNWDPTHIGDVPDKITNITATITISTIF